jgi:hypothetical protein
VQGQGPRRLVHPGVGRLHLAALTGTLPIHAVTFGSRRRTRRRRSVRRWPIVDGQSSPVRAPGA